MEAEPDEKRANSYEATATIVTLLGCVVVLRERGRLSHSRLLRLLTSGRQMISMSIRFRLVAKLR